MFKIFSTYICCIYKMQRLEVSGAVRLIYGTTYMSTGVKGLMFNLSPRPAVPKVCAVCFWRDSAPSGPGFPHSRGF